MAQYHPEFDTSYFGGTNPRRHRTRRALMALLLVGMALACLVALGALGRAIYLGVGGRSSAPAEAALQGAGEAGSREAGEASGAAAADEGAGETGQAAGEVPEPELEPAVATVDVMMIGDLLMHEGVIYSGEREDGSFDYRHLFAQIASDIEAADLAILNQETVLGGTAWPYLGYPEFNSPQELGDAEAEAGFDLVLKATNHTFDLGYDGVHAELTYWAEAHPEMAVIGMADPLAGTAVCPAGTTSPAGAYVFERDGLRVAVLNYTDVLNAHIDYDYDPYVLALMDEWLLRSDIAAAREQADLVIVCPHWGDEYVTVPNERQRWWAQIMLEEGVDVVIGGHPHVIEPVEVLEEDGHRMLVFWSVGNFVSTQAGAENMVGGMAKVRLVEDADGARVGDYEFVPLVTQREPSTTNMTTYRLDAYTDALAEASSIGAIDGGRGSWAGWYQDYCAEVLGDAFDRATLTVHGSLG